VATPRADCPRSGGCLSQASEHRQVCAERDPTSYLGDAEFARQQTARSAATSSRRHTAFVFVVVVIGPPGSGKTTVLTALHDVLADDHISHAVVEVEAVAWASPGVTDEQSIRHLATIRGMYADAGYPIILCGATVTSAEYMSELLEALAADDRLVVRLEAAPITLRNRIVERELAGWSGLPHLLQAADEIAATSRLLEDIDIVCSTEDTTPLAVAAQVRSARPALLFRSS
jgi:predicted kinase